MTTKYFVVDRGDLFAPGCLIECFIDGDEFLLTWDSNNYCHRFSTSGALKSASSVIDLSEGNGAAEAQELFLFFIRMGIPFHVECKEEDE